VKISWKKSWRKPIKLRKIGGSERAEGNSRDPEPVVDSGSEFYHEALAAKVLEMEKTQLQILELLKELKSTRTPTPPGQSPARLLYLFI